MQIISFLTDIPIQISLLTIISMACRALQEIAKWRIGMQWLPAWMFGTGGWMNLDGYHITTTVHWMTAIALGQELAIYRNGERLDFFDWCWIWFSCGQFMDIFYHTIWMKRPEFHLAWFFAELAAGWRWVREHLR